MKRKFIAAAYKGKDVYSMTHEELIDALLEVSQLYEQAVRRVRSITEQKVLSGATTNDANQP